MLIVLTIPAIIVFITLLLTYRSVAKYKNGMLFAVTLPPHVLEHSELQSIQATYRKQFKATWIGILIAYLPLFAMNQWAALQIIYYLLWITISIVVVVFPFRKAFRATLALKRHEEWFVGEKRVIHADLRAAQLKNKRAASPALFVLPLALSVLLTIWAGSADKQLYGIGVCAMVITLLMLGAVMLMLRSKATVYSEHSEVNIALNQLKRRSLSYLFFTLALVENVHFYLIAQQLLNENEQIANLWLGITIGFTLLPAAMIIIVYRRVNAMQREMLELEGKPIYSDDDEYWANGFTYHNPYDKSIMVPKRVGIGETINTGTIAGKIIMGGAVGLFVVVVFGVSFMLIRSELTAPSLTISSDAQVMIDYPMYSFSFAIEEIEEAELVDSVPSGVKTNGEAVSSYARGHFRLKDIGKARLYVFKNNPPYIRLKLADQVVYYNDADPEATKALFEQLQNAMR